MSTEDREDWTGEDGTGVVRRPCIRVADHPPSMPVIYPRSNGDVWKGCPRAVPWSVVEGREEQAMINHGQTLAQLAKRGGLSPDELFAVAHRQPWGSSRPRKDLIAWFRGLAEE